jgi:hypothetical protein
VGDDVVDLSSLREERQLMATSGYTPLERTKIVDLSDTALDALAHELYRAVIADETNNFGVTTLGAIRYVLKDKRGKVYDPVTDSWLITNRS